MTQQEKRVSPPDMEHLQAWLAQLQADRKEQEQVVMEAARNLDQAKRDAEQIQRDITACNGMMAALKEAGHR